MIITFSDLTAYTVDIEKSYQPAWFRAIKFYSSFSQSILNSDRGIDSDKYSCSFSIIGDIDDLKLIATSLNGEKKQITIDTEGEKIFGPAIDHTSVFTCNILNDVSYPIRDILTVTIPLSVQVVSPVVYDGAVSSILPELFYQLPVNRLISFHKRPFSATTQGDYGNMVRVDSSGDTINAETATIEINQTGDELAQLQKYLSTKRGDSFIITTTNIELFLNSLSTSVIATAFSFRQTSVKFWTATLTLVKA